MSISVGKANIKDAAKSLVLKKGIKGTTMRGIADEAGVSTGAIYHYYKSKEEILYEVMEETLTQSRRTAAASAKKELTRDMIVNDICKNIERRLRSGDENKVQFYLIYEAMLGDPILKENLQSRYREWIGYSEELILSIKGINEHPLSKPMATMILAAIDGLIMQSIIEANDVSVESFMKLFKILLSDVVSLVLG